MFLYVPETPGQGLFLISPDRLPCLFIQIVVCTGCFIVLLHPSFPTIFSSSDFLNLELGWKVQPLVLVKFLQEISKLLELCLQVLDLLLPKLSPLLELLDGFRGSPALGHHTV